MRTLAKRSMSRSGEHTVPGVSEYAVYKIKSGFCHDVSSVSGDCTISLSWTEGYITRSSPAAVITVGEVKSKKVNARDFVTTANWTGFYDIDVEIQYVYDLVEYIENEDGEKEMVLTPKRASDYVVINKPVTFFDENLQTNH